MAPVIGYIVTTVHRIDYLTIQPFNAAKPFLLSPLHQPACAPLDVPVIVINFIKLESTVGSIGANS
jgi:hypothetical protein